MHQSKWAVGIAAVVMAAAAIELPPVGRAQSRQYEEVEGPLYVAQHFYTTPILGLRLGMTPAEAIAVVTSRGFEGPGQESLPPPDHDAVYWAADRSNFSLQFQQVGGRRLLTSFSFDGKYAPEAFADVEARRADLVAMLGTPTHWLKWVHDDNRLSDRFYYARDRDVFDRMQDALSCFLNWGCATLNENSDCRERVSGVGGVIVQGGFVGSSLYFSVQDYDLKVAELVAEPGFQERRPVAPVICPVNRVH